MDKEMPNEQKKLTCQQGVSKPKEPNMKMRMPGKNYTDPGYYFITMVVLGRRRLFGRIVGDANVPVGEPGSPAIEYSPYGIRIARALEHLGRIGPWAGLLEIKGKQVMPDHIHVLIYVKQRLPKVLGTVLNGFLITCRHEWRDMCSGEDAVHRDGYLWPLPEGQTSEPQPQEDGALRLFEKGFNDNVIYKAGQLDAYYHYMRNNPKRWLLKERYPELFVKRWGKELLPGTHFNLVGNMFLLERPWRIPVRISRFAMEQEAYDPEHADYEGTARYVMPRRVKTEAEIKAAIEPYLRLARRGAVLVTPCIGPAEQAVVHEAYAEGLPVIMFCFNGFSSGYHPTEAHYDACARGLLLQLAPWSFDPGRKMTKNLCETLNVMARTFATKGQTHG